MPAKNQTRKKPSANGNVNSYRIYVAGSFLETSAILDVLNPFTQKNIR